MSLSDAEIGKNIARIRGARSQADVAAAMRTRGFKWSQTTMWKVESGERPLRFAEASELAEVLGIGLSEFTFTTHAALIVRYATQQQENERKLRTAVAAFLTGQRELAACADFVADETGFVDDELAQRVTDLLTTTPETVAEQERVAVRHETESKESLRRQQEALQRATDGDRAESIPPLEELYALERDGRYAQILDASWSKPNG